MAVETMALHALLLSALIPEGVAVILQADRSCVALSASPHPQPTPHSPAPTPWAPKLPTVIASSSSVVEFYRQDGLLSPRSPLRLLQVRRNLRPLFRSQQSGSLQRPAKIVCMPCPRLFCSACLSRVMSGARKRDRPSRAVVGQHDHTRSLHEAPRGSVNQYPTFSRGKIKYFKYYMLCTTQCFVCCGSLVRASRYLRHAIT